MYHYLCLALLVTVVKGDTLDLDKFGITWLLPLPTENVVTPAYVTTTSAPVTSVKAAKNYVTSVNEKMTSALVEVDSMTFVTSSTSTTPMTFAPVTFIPRATPVTVMSSTIPPPMVAPDIQKFDATVSDLNLKIEAVTFEIDLPLTSSSPLTRALTSTVLPVIENLENVYDPLDEIEDQIGDLEKEIGALNVTHGDENDQSNHLFNIWTKTAEFLDTTDGLVFLLILIFAGKSIVLFH